MNAVRESGERRFVLYKVRYAALALVWLGALIATWVYWPDLGWPTRVCLTVVLALATPSLSELFESYPQEGGTAARKRHRGVKQRSVRGEEQWSQR